MNTKQQLFGFEGNKAAYLRVQLTAGSLRVFQAFSWL
jgi:hypothetical protein